MWLISSSYGVTTVTRHCRFHTDRSNSKNGNITTDDENVLADLRCYCCAKILL